MNKMFNLIVASLIATSLLFASCAGFQGKVESTLGSPAQVQADVKNTATVAYAHSSPQVRAAVHSFNLRLAAAGDLDTAELRAMVPRTGNANADAAIAAAVSYLDSAIQKFGSNNPTTIAYVKAVNVGLTEAGF
jgi:hypothetical protein